MWQNWPAAEKKERTMGRKDSDCRERKDFLICVDSDGCAMNTMDVKHFRCFGPAMVAEWGLENWRDEILFRWNEINLYTMSRGINRFQGLAKALREVQEKYCEIQGLETLESWVKETPELSNAALKREIEKKDNLCLQKALSWSTAVNQAVEKLPQEEKRPFDGVREALEEAGKHADIAVVSSANRDAVLEEWNLHGLLKYTDVVLAQDAGSKAFCIEKLLRQGYEKEHVVMCGDAPGDMQAAEKNGVYFYPILVRHETESWEEFRTKGLKHLWQGTYGEQYQQEKSQQFLNHLNRDSEKESNGGKRKSW